MEKWDGESGRERCTQTLGSTAYCPHALRWRLPATFSRVPAVSELIPVAMPVTVQPPKPLGRFTGQDRDGGGLFVAILGHDGCVYGIHQDNLYPGSVPADVTNYDVREPVDLASASFHGRNFRNRSDGILPLTNPYKATLRQLNDEYTDCICFRSHADPGNPLCISQVFAPVHIKGRHPLWPVGSTAHPSDGLGTRLLVPADTDIAYLWKLEAINEGEFPCVRFYDGPFDPKMWPACWEVTEVVDPFPAITLAGLRLAPYDKQEPANDSNVVTTTAIGLGKRCPTTWLWAPKPSDWMQLDTDAWDHISTLLLENGMSGTRGDLLDMVKLRGVCKSWDVKFNSRMTTMMVDARKKLDKARSTKLISDWKAIGDSLEGTIAAWDFMGDISAMRETGAQRSANPRLIVIQYMRLRTLKRAFDTPKTRLLAIEEGRTARASTAQSSNA